MFNMVNACTKEEFNAMLESVRAHSKELASSIISQSEGEVNFSHKSDGPHNDSHQPKSSKISKHQSRESQNLNGFKVKSAMPQHVTHKIDSKNKIKRSPVKHSNQKQVVS